MNATLKDSQTPITDAIDLDPLPTEKLHQYVQRWCNAYRDNSRKLEADRAALIAALESAADGFRVIADKAAPTVAKYAAEKRDAASAVLAQVRTTVGAL